MYPLRVFLVYSKDADPSDLTIEKQRFSTFDTHERAIAIPLPPFYPHTVHLDPHRNQRFLVGPHQEVRRFVPSDLHHISQ